MRGPCYNCEKRKLYCHSNCSDYISFKERRSAILQKRSEENAKIRQFITSIESMTGKKLSTVAYRG